MTLNSWTEEELARWFDPGLPGPPRTPSKCSCGHRPKPHRGTIREEDETPQREWEGWVIVCRNCEVGQVGETAYKAIDAWNDMIKRYPNGVSGSEHGGKKSK